MVKRVSMAEARAAAAEAAEDDVSRQAARWKGRCEAAGREVAEEREAAKRQEQAAAAAAAMSRSAAEVATAQKRQSVSCAEQPAASGTDPAKAAEAAAAQCTQALAEAVRWQQERLQRIDATLAAAAKAAGRASS